MPEKLIPGEKRTPVYKKGPFKMGYKHSAFPFFTAIGAQITPPKTETDATGGFATSGGAMSRGVFVGVNPNVDRINELEKELAALKGF